MGLTCVYPARTTAGGQSPPVDQTGVRVRIMDMAALLKIGATIWDLASGQGGARDRVRSCGRGHEKARARRAGCVAGGICLIWRVEI